MSKFTRQHTRYDVQPIPDNVITFRAQQDAYSAQEERAEERRRQADARAKAEWERKQKRERRLASAIGVGILIGLAGPVVTITVGAVVLGYAVYRIRRAYRQAIAMGWV